MKVAELEGALLDYWVARAEFPDMPERAVALKAIPFSSSWQHGGPIIGRALISVLYGPVDSLTEPGYWTGFIRPSDDEGYDGPTQLVAAMRAYVTSKFGHEVPEVSL
ncbi:hypothetical protein UB46_23615 [Burkholderiaceae bacterium 16]|nr:hypothetical protein UB46_23615 [Burkholderiaceae bacterium 16]